MSNPVIIIDGSTRESGNTDTLLSELIRGANDSGINLDRYFLRNLNIADCIGCCQCLHERTCHFDDAMTDIRKSLMEAQLIIFASPLYWCEVTGLMKIFVDRLYFFHHPENRPMIAGKKAIVLTTLGEKDNTEYESSVLVEFYKRFLNSLGFIILDMMFFDDLMDDDAVRKRPEYLERAYLTGKSLS
jgi:multimeric flavodoxin WrbA